MSCTRFRVECICAYPLELDAGADRLHSRSEGSDTTGCADGARGANANAPAGALLLSAIRIGLTGLQGGWVRHRRQVIAWRERTLRALCGQAKRCEATQRHLSASPPS